MTLEHKSKECPSCTKYLPFSSFHKNKTKRYGLESHCKRCRAIRGNEYRKKRKRDVEQRTDMP